MRFEPIQLGNHFGISLNIEDLDIDHKDRLQPLLVFHTKYTVLREHGNKPERFNTVLGAANWYLARAKLENKRAIAEFFAAARYMIAEDMPKVVNNASQLLQFIRKLGEMYLNVVDQCELIQAFREYSLENVKVQDISGYGDRPQDSKELSFSLDEMYEVMDIAFLCKLCAPIFGELLTNIPDQFDADGKKKKTVTKESRISVFMDPVIRKHFAAVDEKMQYFVEHVVTNQCKNDEVQNSAPVFSGFIIPTRVALIMSQLLIRDFVTVDIEKDESNVVRYVDTMTHNHVITQNTAANKNQVRQRIAVSAYGASEDSNNWSQMEVDSVISDRPLDIKIIVENSVSRAIDDFLIERQITHEELDKCVKYLMRELVMPTPLNKFLIVAIFGSKIGGGSGVDLIARKSLTKLTALLQLTAFQHSMFELGHMLTAKKSEQVRVVEGDEEIKFRNSFRTSYDYATCRERFDNSSKTSEVSEWDRQMSDICDDIVQSFYLYNTPPFILEQLVASDPNALEINGKVIPTDVRVINEACSLISLYGK